MKYYLVLIILLLILLFSCTGGVKVKTNNEIIELKDFKPVTSHLIPVTNLINISVI